MPTPAAVLASMLRADSARPRVTFYDDTPGPTQGERIELSGRVLANWVAKAANALAEEYDAGPGTVVRLALPPLHWRTLYWALAVWSVGGTVLVAPGASDVLVTDDVDLLAAGRTVAPESGAAEGRNGHPGTSGASSSPTGRTAAPESVAGEAVLVTLGALARAHPGPVPPGAMDEARELATYGDQFTAWAEPAPADIALIGKATHPYVALVTDRGWPPGPRVNLAGTFEHDLEGVLTAALAAWAVDGSVVLQRGPEGTDDAATATTSKRLAAEGVTLNLA